MKSCIMLQGTASSVGKSLLTLGIGRWCYRQGLKVAPFKSQNMALNAGVTADGCEIGRAQYEQAMACGILPLAAMNPILLKPESETGSQVVVRGQYYGSMRAEDYHEFKPKLREIIAESLQELQQSYDVVLIEGAGSPAEVNLKAHEIVNMFVAKLAKAPVFLIGDIDRGGVFASLIGTHMLLEPDEQELVKGFIINRFRGSKALLDDGLRFLEAYTNIPVQGVVPYIDQLRIAEEDSLGLHQHRRLRNLPASGEDLLIQVIRLPRLSNYDEFDSLEHEPGISLRYIDQAEQALKGDLVIIPGSKATFADLQWLRETGFADVLQIRHHNRQPILGICGGAQMLARKLYDQHGLESPCQTIDGLDLLPYDIEYCSPKITSRTQAVWVNRQEPSMLAGLSQDRLETYEIHFGRFRYHQDPQGSALFHLKSEHHNHHHDGAMQQFTLATMLHGLFDNQSWRHALLQWVAHSRQHLWRPRGTIRSRFEEYDRLADHLAAHLDLEQMLEQGRRI